MAEHKSFFLKSSETFSKIVVDAAGLCLYAISTMTPVKHVQSSDDLEKMVSKWETESMRLRITADEIWSAADTKVSATGGSPHQRGYWDLVEAAAGEPYKAAKAAQYACMTDDVRLVLPAVRRARKMRQQTLVRAAHGGGYDNDVGSGYGDNSHD